VASVGDKGEPEDVVIARIAKARGIKGEVACSIETDFPERFQELEEVIVWMPAGERLRLKVEDQWFHKDRVIFKFEGYDTMSAAERLVGGRLVISESDALELDQDEFYEYQLIGLEAVRETGESIGRVVRLLRTGGTDVLVIEGADGREILVPFAVDICGEPDFEAGRIVIEPPEGLLEL
jgi:16S rRNA processing protein RimM